MKANARKYKGFFGSICIMTYVSSVQYAFKHASLMMFLLGLTMLSVGLNDFSNAEFDLGETLDDAESWVEDHTGGAVSLDFGSGSDGTSSSGSRDITVDLTYIEQAVCKLYMLIEGSFGALIMTISGIGAIASAAFGNYKGSISMIIVSCGAFTLRSLVSVFFGTIEDCGPSSSRLVRVP